MPLNLSSLTVLMIEDVKPMRKLTQQVLESLGVGKVVTAENGREGFEVLKKNNPDIVICDWDMPEWSGIDFLNEVRTNPLAPNRMVPIIMVSGYTAVERVVSARDAGVTEYMVKPFSARDLANRITYVINKPRDFVDSGDYTGPDRRRRKDPAYGDKHRRHEDKENSP